MSFEVSDIEYFINNLSSYSEEDIASWLHKVKANGLSDEELFTLTKTMANSGTVIDWTGFDPIIDKHSSGGIGDKVTLLFAPLMAACGVYVPKLSGRGLGITGGTIDKLESIQGFNTNLSILEIKKQVKEIGLSISSAGKDLAPADKTLYAIRDVTDTVDSIPLLASSIMSKKIATGSNNIVLDVKYGSGSFLQDLERAKKLAETMVSIGKSFNKNITALVTNMDEPLGHNIGNSLEVIEVLEVLSGKQISDLVEVTLALAEEALKLTNISPNKPLEKILLGGDALAKFELMISYQNGNLSKGFKKARSVKVLTSREEGFIKHINALPVGEVVHALGSGRHKVSDDIDNSVGIKLLKKHGDKVSINDPILEIHAKSEEEANSHINKLNSAITIDVKQPSPLKLINSKF